MKNYFFILLVMSIFPITILGQAVTLAENPIDKLEISILYDNYICTKGSKADWGLSCLILADNQRILFDAGGKTEVVKENADVLKTDLSNLDQIFISHNHWDHIGGLEYILDKNPDFPISLPYPPDGNLKKLQRFREAFGEGFIEMGTGRVIVI